MLLSRLSTSNPLLAYGRGTQPFASSFCFGKNSRKLLYYSVKREQKTTKGLVSTGIHMYEVSLIK